MRSVDWITIAVPKGRVLAPLYQRLRKAGIAVPRLLSDDRTLVREKKSHGLRFLLLKPSDVPTYVEYGAADLGVVGRDVLSEHPADLYVPVDLRIGLCRLVLAGPSVRSARPVLRIATKYPRTTSRFFAARGEQVDTVRVEGSVELAPQTGLADSIVDLVETGETLRQNGLVEYETIAQVSTVLVTNRSALKLRRERLSILVTALGRASE